MTVCPSSAPSSSVRSSVRSPACCFPGARPSAAILTIVVGIVAALIGTAIAQVLGVATRRGSTGSSCSCRSSSRSSVSASWRASAGAGAPPALTPCRTASAEATTVSRASSFPACRRAAQRHRRDVSPLRWRRAAAHPHGRRARGAPWARWASRWTRCSAVSRRAPASAYDVRVRPDVLVRLGRVTGPSRPRPLDGTPLDPRRATWRAATPGCPSRRSRPRPAAEALPVPRASRSVSPAPSPLPRLVRRAVRQRVTRSGHAAPRVRSGTRTGRTSPGPPHQVTPPDRPLGGALSPRSGRVSATSPAPRRRVAPASSRRDSPVLRPPRPPPADVRRRVFRGRAGRAPSPRAATPSPSPGPPRVRAISATADRARNGGRASGAACGPSATRRRAGWAEAGPPDVGHRMRPATQPRWRRAPGQGRDADAAGGRRRESKARD